MITIKISDTVFYPWLELASVEERMGERADIGATATFTGTMRDFNYGNDVTAMRLGHDPGKTENMLAGLERDARNQWDIEDVFILHRVGEIKPSDLIVLVSVWSAYRKDAFKACRGIIKSLKSTVPFWKKEVLTDGSTHWVESNNLDSDTPDSKT